MIYAIAFTIHLLSAIVWVGGMFFAYMALRPAVVQTLEGPMRLKLWVNTFSRFFPWVIIAIILLITTGLAMIYTTNMKIAPYIHVMIGMGVVMMLIFGHVYFAGYKKLCQAVTIEDWQTGAAKLGMIRKLVAVNLSIGLILVAVTGMAKYMQ